MQTTHDRPLLRSERSSRIPVGEPDDIHRHERLAQRLGQAVQRVVDRAHLHHLGDDRIAAARRRRLGSLFERNLRHALRARPGDPRVTKDPQQIREVLVATDEPRPAQDPLERILDEVLGVLGRATQPVRGAVQTLDVVTETLWFEAPFADPDLHGASIPAPAPRTME